MGKSALPNTVCPQGVTVLKAFAFEPACSSADRIFPLQIFVSTNRRSSNLFCLIAGTDISGDIGIPVVLETVCTAGSLCHMTAVLMDV